MALLSPLEQIMGGSEYFGLKLTKVQRAIARACDGHAIGAEWNHPDVRQAFNNVLPDFHEWRKRINNCWNIESGRPFEVVLCAGIRGGKSMLAAAIAWDRALNCDLDWWNPKESEPILPVLSVRRHNAEAVFKHIRGLGRHSPFSQHVIKENADSLVIKHPKTGAHITIMVTASSRAASSVSSYWLVSCVFDEAPKMTGRDESVLNLEDAQVEVRERIVPGGQIIYVGSPWRPEGPVYRMVQEGWGYPSQRRIVIRATGPMLNPSHWNKKRVERLEKSIDAQDREIYRTSVLGEFLESDEALISMEELAGVTRSAPLDIPAWPNTEYVAAMDPATRRNSWTLVIAGRAQENLISIVCAKEWVPTGRSRLVPDEVMKEIAEWCRKYNVTRVMTDGWSVDAIRILAAQVGLVLVEASAQGKTRFLEYDSIRLAVQRGTIDLPPLETMQRDLLRITKRAGASTVQIHLPETSDGRHCDFAPPLATILAHPPAYTGRKLPTAVLDDAEAYELQLASKVDNDWLGGIAAAF